jgi:hypothetical protein
VPRIGVTLGRLEGNLRFEDEELDPTLDLFDRLYFKRIWMRQELALASRAVVYCGSHTVEWEDFRKVVAALYYKNVYYTIVSEGRFPAFQEARVTLQNICGTATGKLRYSHLRIRFGNAECKDTRDKIYAILALLSEADRQLGIKPNYSQTVEELYTDVARRVIVRQHRLDLLGSCDIAMRKLRIPSWVPDWSIPLPMSDVPVTQWSACGWITFQANVLSERWLGVSGVKVCRVQELIGPDTVIRVDLDGNSGAIITAILRDLMPSPGQLIPRASPDLSRAQLLCSATLKGKYSESYSVLKCCGVQ